MLACSGEAAQALARLPALPELVVLDLHCALPEERLLPEDKSEMPHEPRARKQAVEQLRRRQGLLILERLRRDYPTLPVVMLTSTGADLGAARPLDPLFLDEIANLDLELQKQLLGGGHRHGLGWHGEAS